ncbi:hypothetical protein UR08_09835 [Listeria kieliensis]|uniref:NlpC/P60 domain-containing protein n=2 Tax=Listeria kieliensis TaxID=1621700 RepID=A0A3D8TSC1_9LIST|nr:hypothetical protein UR08_09835 [Listeria kieliensis]
MRKRWWALGSVLLICLGILFFQPSEVKAAGNTEEVINWFKAREGKVTYSMANRNGPYSYDCSSAVYHALIEGGFLPKGTAIGNTESLYALEGKLLVAISASEVKRGDIFVSGTKGGSSGGNGHTGVFTSSSTIIHCNATSNGISETPVIGWVGGPPTYYYRLIGSTNDFPRPAIDESVAIVRYVPGYGVNGYRSDGTVIPGSNLNLKHGTSWKTFGSKMIKGREMFLVGNNYYLPREYTNLDASVLTVNYTPGYGVNTYHRNGQWTGKRLPTGSSWKAYGFEMINGQIMYGIGTNEYLPKRYTQFGNGK